MYISPSPAASPSYNPPAVQVAIIAHPFNLDLNYTATHPPSSFMWLKNGRPIEGDGARITLDHTGVTFSRVLQEDAGQYTVVAKNDMGKAKASSTLKGECHQLWVLCTASCSVMYNYIYIAFVCVCVCVCVRACMRVCVHAL